MKPAANPSIDMSTRRDMMINPFLPPRSNVELQEHFPSAQKARPVLALVVLACYLLSIFGIVGSFGSLFSGRLWDTVFGLLLSYAWICHFVMSGGWIKNKRVNKFWPVTGTISALSGLLLFPVRHYFMHSHGPEVFGFSLLLSIFALPSILLALFLVCFHLSENESAPPIA